MCTHYHDDTIITQIPIDSIYEFSLKYSKNSWIILDGTPLISIVRGRQIFVLTAGSTGTIVPGNVVLKTGNVKCVKNKKKKTKRFEM